MTKCRERESKKRISCSKKPCITSKNAPRRFCRLLSNSRPSVFIIHILRLKCQPFYRDIIRRKGGGIFHDCITIFGTTRREIVNRISALFAEIAALCRRSAEKGENLRVRARIREYFAMKTVRTAPHHHAKVIFRKFRPLSPTRRILDPKACIYKSMGRFRRG